MGRIFNYQAARQAGYSDDQIRAYLGGQSAPSTPPASQPSAIAQVKAPVQPTPTPTVAPTPDPAAAPVAQPAQPSKPLQGAGDFMRTMGFGAVPDALGGLQDAAGNVAQWFLNKSGSNKKVQKSNDFLTPQQQADNSAHPIRKTAEDAAGIASWMVPGGEGASLAGKIIKPIASGAASGALNAFANSGNDSAMDTAKEVGTGTATGGIVSGATRAATGIVKAVGKAAGGIPDRAAASVNKATPAMQSKARDAGLDLNALTKKYYKPGTAIEDAIGTADQRNVGGYMGDHIKNAEDKLQAFATGQEDKPFMTGQKVIAALEKERDAMSGKLGEGGKRAQMDEIIKEAQAKYKNGVTVGGGLDTVRQANHEFGKDQVLTGSEAISSSAQKLEADIIRKELKSEFPIIKDALNTQHEVYTLLPSLRAAAGKEAANGIKTGKIDLTKPGTLIDPILNNPEVASTIMKPGVKLPEFAGQAGNTALDVTNRAAPVAAGGFAANLFGSKGSGQPQQDQPQNQGTQGEFNTPNEQPNQQPNVSLNHGQSLAQPASNVNTTGSGGDMVLINGKQVPVSEAVQGSDVTPPHTKQEYVNEIDKQTKVGGTQGRANAQLLMAQMKQYYPDEAGSKPLTEPQVKDRALASAGLSALGTLKKEIGYDGKSGAVNIDEIRKLKLTNGLSNPTLYKALSDAADARLRLETGAQANPAEIKQYVNNFLTLSDNPKSVGYAINYLESYLGDIKGQKPAGIDPQEFGAMFGAGANP